MPTTDILTAPPVYRRETGGEVSDWLKGRTARNMQTAEWNPGLSSSKSYVLFTSALSPWFQANSCKNLHHSPKQKKHVLRGPVRAARMSMGCCAEQPPRDPGSHGLVQPCSQMQRVPTVVPRCHFCGLVCPRHAGKTLTPPRSLGPPGNVAECLRRIQASLTRPVPPRATIYIIS